MTIDVLALLPETHVLRELDCLARRGTIVSLRGNGIAAEAQRIALIQGWVEPFPGMDVMLRLSAAGKLIVRRLREIGVYPLRPGVNASVASSGADRVLVHRPAVTPIS